MQALCYWWGSLLREGDNLFNIPAKKFGDGDEGPAAVAVDTERELKK